MTRKKKYIGLRHPFTAFKKQFIKFFLNDKIDLEKINGDCFDLVCNGEEIVSGGMRIYEFFLQEKVFKLLGYNSEQIQKNFGYFLEALSFAAPPHGGFGFGIDRFLSVILGIKNIKELLAFPKNIDGTCSLTGAPNFFD